MHVSLLAAFPITFEQPVWLWLLAAIPVLVVLSYRSLAGLERGRRLLALTLRSLVIAAIAFALSRVAWQKESDELTVIFLVDRSHSIPLEAPSNPDAAGDAWEEYVRQIAKRAKSEKIGVITFAGEAHLEQLPMKGNVYVDTISSANRPDATNIAQAFRLAMASFPERSAKRIVLLTDGNENNGDVLHEVAIAEASGVSVDVVPIRYAHRNEVLFDRLVVPTRARMRERIPVRMILRSDRTVQGTVHLLHNGQPVPLGESGELGKPVELSPGVNPLQMKLPLYTSGPHRFEARFEANDKNMDQVVENNQATGYTLVEGKGLVLLLTNKPEDDEPLLEALRREQIEAVMHTADEVPIEMLELQQYGVIVLANMPADRFTREQQEVFVSYVKDFGGGLIMTGGDEGFGAGGWIGSPVEKVMPVDFEIKQRRIIPRGALAVIMHTCELPRANHWGEQVALAAMRTISTRDYFGLLAYSGLAGGENWEVPLDLATDKEAIARKIRKMQIGDMPDFIRPMRMVVEALKARTDAAQKHMIIISDGDANINGVQPILDDMVKNRITCSTVGIGYGVHVQEAPLKQIAATTKGRFYAVRNPRRLPQIFVKEAKVVRKPLISEQPFTPRLVYAFSPIMAGLSDTALPPLGGMVLTQKKQDEQVEMPLVRASTEGNDPVLAHWQYELGRTVAFTSGYWPRWGTQWLGWEQFSKLWGQTVRWAMRQNKASEFQVFTKLEGDQGRVVIEALNKDASYLNFLRLQSGRVIGPNNTSQNLQLVQTGSGRYEATFDARQRGQYLVNMSVRSPDDEDVAFISTGLAIPFSPEYRDLASNETLLSQIIETTSEGKQQAMNPELDDVFRRPTTPIVSLQPIWPWVIAWILLPLFLLDVACRRLASVVALSIFIELLIVVVLLFGVGVWYGTWWGKLGVFILAELVGWTIRYQSIEPTLRWLTHSVTVLGRAGERSTQSLSQLKTTRDRVRETATGPSGGASQPTAGPAPNPQTRYDAGESAQTQAPTTDLAQALGGAETTDATKRPAPKTSPPSSEAGEEDLTSRLLRAKKRARRDLEGRDKDGHNE